jgi:two-component system, OmpR family, KDP operon response regulator KdpE
MIEGATVLVIEDEPQVRRLLHTSLEARGYRVLEAATGGEGLNAARQYVPDVVILDLGLPDLDGIDVARGLRSWSHTPIIVLSARGMESQKVEALDAGADDYLTKPFGVQELLARIRVALRHSARAKSVDAEGIFESGPLRVDLVHRRVHVAGEEVHLTPIEYRILVVLVRNAGKVVTHKQLLESVWGPNAAGRSHYLRVHMTHLRRKLEQDPARSRIFSTEVGIGYRLHVEE